MVREKQDRAVLGYSWCGLTDTYWAMSDIVMKSNLTIKTVDVGSSNGAKRVARRQAARNCWNIAAKFSACVVALCAGLHLFYGFLHVERTDVTTLVSEIPGVKFRNDDQRRERIAKHKEDLWKTLRAMEMNLQRRDPENNSSFPTSLIGRLAENSTLDVLCELKRRVPFAITRSNPAFAKSPMKNWFPTSSEIMTGKKFGKCAVVSSSGCLLTSSLGSKIDEFEQILRANAAPTVGFENHVGSRTTIRILNNFEIYGLTESIMIRPYEHQRPINYPDTQNATLIGWDVCSHRGAYDHRCLENMNSTKISRVVSNEPLQPFFKFRAANPDREIYFLDPEWIWSIADILQEMSTVHLRTLAPSSGFIGSVLLMHFCDEVHLFEMIPSLREDSKKEIICRYHEPHRYTGDPIQCTLFRGHQRQQELMALMRFNVANDEQTFGTGHAIVPGLAKIKC